MLTDSCFIDYEQYYASLAASAAASAQATPSGSVPGSSDFDDDEEDRKPSIEYLNSLNDYRKRSRSQEDEGFAGRNKIAKSDSFTNGEPQSVPMNVDIEVHGNPAPKDDPIVYGGSFYTPVVAILKPFTVNGNPIPLSKVTEEDHELMTPEEYTAYFEVMQSLEE